MRKLIQYMAIATLVAGLLTQGWEITHRSTKQVVIYCSDGPCGKVKVSNY